MNLKQSPQTTTHLVWLPRYQWYRNGITDKHSIQFCTITVTFILNTKIQSLFLIIMHHQTKFGCKMITSSEDIIETINYDCMCPQYEPDLSNSKTNPFAWDSGSWWHIALLCLATKGWIIQKISSRQTFNETWTRRRHCLQGLQVRQLCLAAEG